jgi:hypothetical protein
MKIELRKLLITVAVVVGIALVPRAVQTVLLRLTSTVVREEHTTTSQ